MLESILARARGARVAAVTLAMGSMVAITGEQLRRIFRARELGKHAPPAFGHRPVESTRRVLIVGDSTGAGVGCESPSESIAGRLVEDYGQLEVHNAAVSGATVVEVVGHVRGLPHRQAFDLVLVFAGGNDVIRRTPSDTLRDATRELLDELDARSERILWVGMANVGLAPAFLPPFSWWLTYRTRRVSRLLAEEVALRGGHFLDFFRERSADPFSADADRYYAGDGVHPSAQAYAYCYEMIRPLIASALGQPHRAPAIESLRPLPSPTARG